MIRLSTTIIENNINFEIMETTKDLIATKRDIYDLYEKLSEKMNTQFRWIVGMFIVQVVFLLAIILLRYS